jgi:hypothetical protein
MTDVFHFAEEELDEAEALWIESALKSKAKAEAEWRRQGKVFAIVHAEPTYVSAANWDFYAEIPDPEAPCDRVIRFDLIGGGQIKSIEHFEPWPNGGFSNVICYDHRLRVTAHCGDSIKRARGEFVCSNLLGPAETNCYSVVFEPGTDQQIADRVAETFQAIGDSSGNFFALLLGGLHCAICKRPLRDEISRLIGVGPDCARQFHIPHCHEAAEKRLALRRKLLGGAS